MNAQLLAFVALAPVPAAAAQAQAQLPYEEAALRPEKPARELLAEAEALVLAGRYAEARPLVDRLASFPEYALQFNFLQGYIALQAGDPATAEQRFRLHHRLSGVRSRRRVGRPRSGQLAASGLQLPRAAFGQFRTGQQ
jgi:Flp pilus assembly protein TadD